MSDAQRAYFEAQRRADREYYLARHGARRRRADHEAAYQKLMVEVDHLAKAWIAETQS